jgi:NADPH:quinone reductase-like Zn-dependent oxidoreductase
VGTAAIQLAKAADATVITTASAAKLERCRELGADHTIDYKNEDFAERVREITGDGVDLVVDFIGAPYWNDNLKALKRGGRLTIIGLMGDFKGDLEVGSILRKSLTVTGTTLRPMPLPQKTALVADFANFGLDRLARGELRPVLDTVFPLSQAAAAHRHMEANANFGKIVLRVDG